jgi:hypothetical protein
MGMDGLLLFFFVEEEMEEKEEEDVGEHEGCGCCDLMTFGTFIVSWSGAVVAAGGVTSSDNRLRRFRFLPMVSSNDPALFVET